MRRGLGTGDWGLGTWCAGLPRSACLWQSPCPAASNGRRSPPVLLTLLLFACSCGRPSEGPAPIRPADRPEVTDRNVEQSQRAVDGVPDAFVDIAPASGIRFQHNNGASARRYLPETMGSGVALFDFDNDGRPDIYFVNGTPLTGETRSLPGGSLYRNIDGARLEDVTARAGLGEPFAGMGAAVGDYDNDGHTDLFVTGVGATRLYRNRGDGTFEDATRTSKLLDKGYSSSAAFVDYDRDGWLDVFVCHYVRWSPSIDVPCHLDQGRRIYCTPEVYPADTCQLYRNVGGREFRDVTRAARILQPEGKALGVAILDYNRDGWPDIAVANDTTRNLLFVNNRDGTFSESGVATSMAYSEAGATRGGMGIDAGDVNGDGLTDLLIGNFSNEMAGLYLASEKGFFEDHAAQSGIGMASLKYLAFGALLVDLDNDGWLDIVLANGHIEPDIAMIQAGQTYAQPPLFFRNLGRGRFALWTDRKGGMFGKPLVGRGLASADIDGDGDLDLVLTQNGGSPEVLRNNTPPRSWLRIQFSGRKSNRNGYGAVVRAVSGKQVWTRAFNSGGSYLSASEPVLTMGFGDTAHLERIEVLWPSGTRQVIMNPRINQVLRLEEP
jgi:enediyne biosynthesis protein E4